MWEKARRNSEKALASNRKAENTPPHKKLHLKRKHDETNSFTYKTAARISPCGSLCTSSKDALDLLTPIFLSYCCTTATFSAMMSVIICSASLIPVASSSAIISS